MEGSDQKFEQLYRGYYAAVYRFLRQMRFSDDEAHDLAQDTFKRVYERLDLFRGDATWSYLQTIAKTVALNAIRSARAQKRASGSQDSLEELLANPDSSEIAADPFAGALSPETEFLSRESEQLRRQQLEEAIAALPSGAQTCLNLWLRGMNYDTIARVLGVTTDAVKSRLRDAKRTLRERMDGSA